MAKKLVCKIINFFKILSTTNDNNFIDVETETGFINLVVLSDLRSLVTVMYTRLPS